MIFIDKIKFHYSFYVINNTMRGLSYHNSYSSHIVNRIDNQATNNTLQ